MLRGKDVITTDMEKKKMVKREVEGKEKHTERRVNSRIWEGRGSKRKKRTYKMFREGICEKGRREERGRGNNRKRRRWNNRRKVRMFNKKTKGFIRAENE